MARRGTDLTHDQEDYKGWAYYARYVADTPADEREYHQKYEAKSDWGFRTKK